MVPMAAPPTPPFTALFRAVGSRPLLIALVTVLAVLALPLYIVVTDDRQIAQRQKEILYRADHAAVLAASREVFANQARYRQHPSWNSVKPGRTDLPDPEDPNV